MSGDVFVITADSVRADHCGWQGGADRTDLTPNLNELANNALSFTSAIAPGPRTPSSIPVSHTSVPFPKTDIDVSNYSERTARVKDHIERFETISEWLEDQGYTTIAFTANPWTTTETSFDTGFNEFTEVGKTGGTIRSLFNDTRFSSLAKRFDQWIHKDSYFSQWRTFYDDLTDAIDHAEKPVFCWAFLLDTHNPYLVPRQDRKETSAYTMWSAMLRANNMPGNKTRDRTARRGSVAETTDSRVRQAYRDCVRSVDTFVGQLKDDIDDDAALIFYSDHGEAFGEHDTYGHEPVLYEENIHVPVLVYDGQTSKTVTEPFSTVELPNIVRALVRDDQLAPAEWTTEYAVARTEDDRSIALRGERWKYIRTDTGEELYDLQVDPEETDDRSETKQDLLSELRSTCEEYIETLPEPSGESDSVENEEMKEHLQDLGYL